MIFILENSVNIEYIITVDRKRCQQFFETEKLKTGKEVMLMKTLLWWLWLMIDPQGCLLETTTKKEREEMGICCERR